MNDENRFGGMRFYDGSDIKPRLSGNYLIKGWLDRGRLSMLYGAPGSGKTFTALDMAAHVAANHGDARHDWFGFRVRGGQVHYIAAEGRGSIPNRVAAIKIARPELDLSRLRVCVDSIDLYNTGASEAFVKAVVDGGGAALIVVDTLVRAAGGGNENSATDMSVVVGNCDRLSAATGAHVMLVHHSGKDVTRGPRGSTVFNGAVDSEVYMQPPVDDEDGTIASSKQRDMETGNSLRFRLAPVFLGKDEDGDDVTSCVVEGNKPTRKPRRLRQPTIK